MADRNLVTYQEGRLEHGPLWCLRIDRSAAGRPGLFVTITSATGSPDDRHIESLNRHMTVVVDDGDALLAPVLAWLKPDIENADYLRGRADEKALQDEWFSHHNCWDAVGE